MPRLAQIMLGSFEQCAINMHQLCSYLIWGPVPLVTSNCVLFFGWGTVPSADTDSELCETHPVHLFANVRDINCGHSAYQVADFGQLLVLKNKQYRYLIFTHLYTHKKCSFSTNPCNRFSMIYILPFQWRHPPHRLIFSCCEMEGRSLEHSSTCPSHDEFAGHLSGSHPYTAYSLHSFLRGG